MKASVERKALSAALKIVAPAVGTSRYHEVLTGVHLDVTKQGLRITCSTLDLTISTHVPGDVGKAGVAIPPARIMSAFIGAGAGDEVELTSSGKDLTAQCGLATIELRCHPTEKWPEIGDIEGEGVHLDVEAVDRLRRIVHAVSTEQSRAELCAVHLEGSTAWATDSYQMCRADLSEDDLKIPAVNIPGVAMAAVLKSVGDNGMTLRVGQRQASIEADNSLWTTSLIPGEYPNKTMANLDRAKSSQSLTFDVQALDDALTRVRTIGADGEIRSVQFTRDGDRMLLTATTLDVGQISDVVPVKGNYDGKFKLHLTYLANLLDHHVGTEVTFEMEGAKPLIARSAGVTQIVMPLKAE